jgi:hypothetical protein
VYIGAAFAFLRDGIRQISEVQLSSSWWNNAANYTTKFRESLREPAVTEKVVQIRRKTMHYVLTKVDAQIIRLVVCCLQVRRIRPLIQKKLHGFRHESLAERLLHTIRRHKLIYDKANSSVQASTSISICTTFSKLECHCDWSAGRLSSKSYLILPHLFLPIFMVSWAFTVSMVTLNFEIGGICNHRCLL